MSAPNAAPEMVTIDGITVEKEALDRISASLKEYWTNRLLRDRKLKEIPEVPHQSSGPADGMPRGSDVSNPTLAKVQRMDELAGKARKLTVWIETVDEVRKGLTDDQGAVVDNEYLLPPKGRKMVKTVCGERKMHPNKYYKCLQEAQLTFLLVLGDPAQNETEQT